jgi:large conductance mechanosensitive channel
MAVGIIIGAAFGSIVKSLVADVIMPPIGLLLGNVDFSNLFAVIKQVINTVISFLIVAFAVFLLIKGLNSLKRQEEAPPEEPTTKECPHCFSEISIKATRCAFCAADIPSS